MFESHANARGQIKSQFFPLYSIILKKLKGMCSRCKKLGCIFRNSGKRKSSDLLGYFYPNEVRYKEIFLWTWRSNIMR